MNSIDKLKFCRTGLSVERFHAKTHIQPYNNGFHSANAALIAVELVRANPKRFDDMTHSLAIVMEHMLTHDCAEGKFGDVPRDVREENPTVWEAIENMESQVLATHGIHKVDMTVHEKNVCKIADTVEVGFYALSELEMGNLKMSEVVSNVCKYAGPYAEDYRLVNEMLNYFTNEALKYGCK